LLRVSLYFAAIALLCLALADIEVTTLDPWGEMQRILAGASSPDLLTLYTFRAALLNTLTFAFCGIALGFTFGSAMAFFFHLRAVRLFCAFIRAIHEIFWAFIFLPIVGLNPVCGVLAIALPYAGIFAKVYAEILQEADQKPLRGLPPHTAAIARFFYGVLPGVYADVANYTSYRFECALRSSAVLGFIGLPTLGFHLETAFREGLYAQAAVLLYAFYLLIASLKYWLKARLVGIYVGLSLLLISKEISLSWTNISRFLAYEILPWPMRRQGFIDGSRDLALPLEALWQWLEQIASSEILPGLWNTLILTQITLVGTGLFTLIGFATLSHHFACPISRRLARYVHIIARTTPEYILAYVFVLLWGPSMLPAIVAITLHNGAILAHLSSQRADLIELPPDAPHKRTNRYFYEILPRIYGQFLAFLFYRWEIIMRESALLGILGIYTLGFFVDSAIADDKLDKAMLLIFCMALLNMGIDSISQRVRRHLRISSGKVRTLDE
jgi:phosphonate transport system permease protein